MGACCGVPDITKVEPTRHKRTLTPIPRYGRELSTENEETIRLTFQNMLDSVSNPNTLSPVLIYKDIGDGVQSNKSADDRRQFDRSLSKRVGARRVVRRTAAQHSPNDISRSLSTDYKATTGTQESIQSVANYRKFNLDPGRSLTGQNNDIAPLRCDRSHSPKHS